LILNKQISAIQIIKAVSQCYDIKPVEAANLLKDFIQGFVELDRLDESSKTQPTPPLGGEE